VEQASLGDSESSHLPDWTSGRLCDKEFDVRRRTGKPNQAATTAAVFGRVLRIKREEAGLSQEKLAALLNIDRSTLTKTESGERVPHIDTVRACDRFLGTEKMLAKLYEEINWHVVVEHPDWFRRRAEMDAVLTELYEYQTQVMPGLLQTETYSRALFQQVEAEDGTSVEDRLAARMSRQRRFLEKGGPLMVALLDESCLRRVVGGSTDMRNQLQHLLDVAELPNVHIQIIPFTFEQVVPPNQPMSLITLPDGHRFVYSESLDWGHFSEDPTVISRHQQTYDRLRADALSPRESADLIRQAMEEYDHELSGPSRRTLAEEQLQRQQRRQLHRNRPRIPRRPRPGA
jgi:transcriptional regulator with XRE-family HTH domain